MVFHTVGSHTFPYTFCEQTGKEVRDISDEIPFDIPESWEWCRLGSVLSIFGRIGFRGYTKADMTTKGSGAITISPSNIKGHDTFFDDCTYISWEKYDESPEIQIENDDLLLVKTGSSYGKCGIVRGLPEKATINPQLVVLKYIIINRKWLLYVLNSQIAKYQYGQFVIGTSIPTISQEKLSKLILPLPPLSEQHRIVSKIEELLPYIDKYEQAETQLAALNTTFPEALKKSILQEAVQGKLVPQDPNDEPASVLLERIRTEKKKLVKEGKIKKDKSESVIVTRDKIPYEIIDGKERCIADEVPFEIPESWCWCRWGNLSESIQYGFNAPAKESGRIKMVRISDIQDNKVLWESVPYCDIDEESIETYLLAPNDILFARTGGTVGKSYLVKDVPEKAIYAGYLIRTRYSNNLSPEYLKFFMESELYWTQLRNGTIATAQPNCNGKTLANMLVPVPPLTEQRRIVSKIEELMKYCEML